MKIIFRADGDSKTGLGHVMRSAALMHMLQPQFNCEFYTKSPNYFPFDDFLVLPQVNEFTDMDILNDAKKVAGIASAGDVVVLDGYQFATSYQQVIKDAGINLVCIDDISKYHFLADAVINHAGGVGPDDYSCESYTNLFLGTDYALIRPHFLAKEKPYRKLDDKKILVSLGGADPNKDTERVLSELIDKDFGEIKVVLGAANKHADVLRDRFGTHSNISFDVNLKGFEMHKLMNSCSYAVLSPSTICYEYMSVGGVVYLVLIADNQKRIKHYFLEEELAFDFNDLGKQNVHDLSASLQKQKVVFSGNSVTHLRLIFETIFQWN